MRCTVDMIGMCVCKDKKILIDKERNSKGEFNVFAEAGEPLKLISVTPHRVIVQNIRTGKDRTLRNSNTWYPATEMGHTLYG